MLFEVINLEIKIIKKNCNNINKLFKNLGKFLEDINQKVKIELLGESKNLNKYNVINTNELVINDNIVSQRRILNEREIKKFICILT